MKTLAILLSTLVTYQSQAAVEKLIDYKFGNQQTGSTLTIFSDGTIVHGERTCCPTRTDQISEPRLTATQLNQLNAEITGASKGMLNAQDGGELKSVSNYGALYAFKNKRPIIIYEVEPVAGRFSLTTNQAREASMILKFVTNYTKVDP